MVQVIKLGYAGFDTVNVEAMLSYYTNVLGLSLIERGENGSAYLRSSLDHHTIALYPALENRLRHIGLQIAGNQSVHEATEQLRGAGIQTEVQSDPHPGISELVQLTDPEGYTIQLYSSMQHIHDGFATQGIVPEKLGHIALAVHNPQRMAEFYQSTLGFRVSDWIDDFFVFMRCSSEHHSLNFLRAKQQKMHHIAFQLTDWAHVQKACDHLAKNGISLLWGPGRHGPGHNIFTYHFDADRQIVELFSELDILNEELGYFEPRPWHEEFPQRPKVWPAIPTTSNHWGLLPAPEFTFEDVEHPLLYGTARVEGNK